MAAEGDVLRLGFNESESLSVWAPRRAVIDRSILNIADVDRVGWGWFYYDRSKLPENRYFLDFVKAGDRIAVTTNVDWYNPLFTTGPERAGCPTLPCMIETP